MIVAELPSRDDTDGTAAATSVLRLVGVAPIELAPPAA